jgi:hypothetical protein
MSSGMLSGATSLVVSWRDPQGWKQIHTNTVSYGPQVIPKVDDASLLQTRSDTISGWWYTYPSEKYESQLGWFFPICGNIKNVPNHRPDIALSVQILYVHRDECTRIQCSGRISHTDNTYKWIHHASLYVRIINIHIIAVVQVQKGTVRIYTCMLHVCVWPRVPPTDLPCPHLRRKSPAGLPCQRSNWKYAICSLNIS